MSPTPTPSRSTAPFGAARIRAAVATDLSAATRASRPAPVCDGCRTTRSTGGWCLGDDGVQLCRRCAESSAAIADAPATLAGN